jgi:pilus assembly protein Flp/PilA
MKKHDSVHRLQSLRRSTPVPLSSENGQGLVEYALVLVLVAIVVIVILTLLSPTITELFQKIPELVRNSSTEQRIAAGVVVLVVIGLWVARLAPQFSKVLTTDVREIEVAQPAFDRIEPRVTLNSASGRYGTQAGSKPSYRYVDISDREVFE